MQTTLQYLTSSLVKSVSEAKLETEPFCNIYMENVFPNYDHLLTLIPDKSLYTPINPEIWRRADGTSTRDYILLDSECVDKLGTSWWCNVAAAIRNITFKQAVLAKLARGLSERLQMSELAVVELAKICSDKIMLMRDTEDYVIDPHTDTINQLVTLQFYLPHDDSQLDLGTSLYKKQDKGFEEVKRYAFKPNSGYAFIVSKGPEHASWHGRQKLLGFKGVRNTLFASFNLKQKKLPRVS